MKKLFLSLLAIGLMLPIAFAQSATGRLVGTVQGPDGVIPGATVIAVDNLTKREIKVVSNGEGAFSIPNLSVGTYTLKVSATGFSNFVANDLKIDVGQEYTFNPKLGVGAVAGEVTVSAGADVINAANAELSNTVTQEQIQNLPINGRNPLSLIQLQAGVTLSGSINGQRTSSTNYTRDGLNVQDNFIRTGGFVPDLPNIDDVSEFSVVTQNSSASVGSGGSSQVQTVTQRGGIDYHGALYEYNQNSAFGSNPFFNNKAGIEKPFLNQNQFGGKILGKLPIPRFGQGGPSLYREKVFFFFDYEGLRLPQTQSTTRTILTPAARQGIFTYIDRNGVQRQDNILMRQGLTLSPIIANRILAGMPTVGNTDDVGDGLNTTGFKFNQRADFTRDATTTRIDYDLSSRSNFNFVWTRRWETILRPDTDGGGFNATPYGNQTATTNLYVFAYTWNSGGRLNNEIRGGLQKSNPFFNTSGLPGDFFIVNPLTSNVENDFLAQGRNTSYYNIQDNAEFTLRQHAFRFGYSGQFYRIRSFGAATLPSYSLDNTFTPFGFVGQAGELSGPLTDPNQLAVANNLQSLLAGLVGSAANTFNVTSKTSGYVAGAPTIDTLNFNDHSFYVSDQWRAKPNLTLNLGLRYEVFTGLKDPRGLRLEPVIPKGTDPVAAILNPSGTYDFVGGNAGNEGQFFKTDKNNFSPIIGIAYTPGFKQGLLRRAFGEGMTTIRGGYRMSYINDEFVRAPDNALQNAGLTQTVTLGELDARIGVPPTIPVPKFENPPITYARNNDLANGFGTVFGVDPNFQLPRVHEYNFGIQRQIGAQTAVEVRYVGAKSDQLVRTIDYNQIDIRDNGFATDFIRARQNLILSGNRSGAFNAAIPGSQPLTVFPNLANGGFLNNAVVIQRLNGGVPADLALVYIQNGLTGNVKFLANPNTGVANLLRNRGRFDYNALQFEVRRRLSKGFFFQGNYTFQKVLTDISPANPGLAGDSQTRVSAFLDNRNTRLDYGRADFDQTHIINFNGSYELPFGNGKKFLSGSNAIVDRLVGGWTVGSIVRINSGFPLSFFDQRGTLNRGGRSGRQAPQTSLSRDQIKDLVGIHEFNGDIYFIDPKIINPNNGRGAAAFGQSAFPGQVFFVNGPGETGNLQRAFINGPWYTQIDISAIKNVRIKERVKMQLRAEAFNALNHTNFFAANYSNDVTAVSNIFNVNSANFGKITNTATLSGLNRVLQLAARLEF